MWRSNEWVNSGTWNRLTGFGLPEAGNGYGRRITRLGTGQLPDARTRCPFPVIGLPLSAYRYALPDPGHPFQNPKHPDKLYKYSSRY
jgi:hypothetical protein